MHIIYLGLGSNIGNREKWLETAIEALNSNSNISIENISPFIETKAIGSLTQPDFINAALKATTLYTPQELLTCCETIEKDCNRTSKGLWNPRTVDIDILFYDDVVISDENLQIPHPLLQDREFVLKPLNAINPNLVHPILNTPISTLLETITSCTN